MSALCTARVLSPLQRMLAGDERGLELLPAELLGAGLDTRLPVELVHDAIERGAQHFGNDLFGLELGASAWFGELGPLDHLLRSAPSASDALSAAARFGPLQSDSYRILFEPFRGGGLLRLLDETCWTRTVADMSMSAAYNLHVGLRAPYTTRLEAWFPYAAPRDRSVHERVFAGASLRFDAPFHAFSFDSSYQKAPQPCAHAGVHAMLCERLEADLADVARSSSAAARVRAAIEHGLGEQREVCLADVARRLRSSARTLSRRLEKEGTTFQAELDTVRHRLALSLVREPGRPVAEVAFMLGFSHVESFHRAFKRWTGQTPLAYRAAADRRRH